MAESTGSPSHEAFLTQTLALYEQPSLVCTCYPVTACRCVDTSSSLEQCRSRTLLSGVLPVRYHVQGELA